LKKIAETGGLRADQIGLAANTIPRYVYAEKRQTDEPALALFAHIWFSHAERPGRVTPTTGPCKSDTHHSLLCDRIQLRNVHLFTRRTNYYINAWLSNGWV